MGNVYNIGNLRDCASISLPVQKGSPRTRRGEENAFKPGGSPRVSGLESGESTGTILKSLTSYISSPFEGMPASLGPGLRTVSGANRNAVESSRFPIGFTG